MQVFVTKTFYRWMRKSGLSEDRILLTAYETFSGLSVVDLGAGLIKKRIATPGRGKRSAARVIITTRKHGRYFFLHGFHKNERTNLGEHELNYVRRIAKDLLELTQHELYVAVQAGQIIEVNHGV
ncbi:MAG: hypothetical protein CK528_04435 [Alcaligenaceae bacterium]|nr:MAG: hypothetical protein CK528_04435 [Alcaligenaceae bacterium]